MELTVADRHRLPDDTLVAEARARVSAFLRILGVRDPAELAALAERCVQHARKRVGDAAGDELNRRALEEARRQHDRWLERNLRLASHPSAQELGRGRTAKLLGGPTLQLPDLRLDVDLTPEQQAVTRSVFPNPTPPEAPLPMPKQALTFVAFGAALEDE